MTTVCLVQIAKTGTVTQGMRDRAWDELLQAAADGKTRKFCREVDGWGLMYAGEDGRGKATHHLGRLAECLQNRV